jgi:rubrerythrin
MDFLTQVLHLVGSSAVAYVTARNMRDAQTRPNTLAGLQLAESGSVPFLEALRDRAAAEGDTWLAEKLAQHALDERRHGQIFAHALKQLNKEVIDFKTVPQTTTEGNPDDRKRSPFFAAYFEGYSPEDLKPQNMDWLVFMGSTYILELDASKDFVRMANALPDDIISNNLRKGMLGIAKDETGHAAYLKEALERRLSITDASAVIDQWRTRKVNAMLAMVGNFMQRSGKFPALAQDRSPTSAAEIAESTTPEPTAA